MDLFSEMYEPTTIKGNNEGKISEPISLNPSLTPSAASDGKIKRSTRDDRAMEIAGKCFIKLFENNFFITVNTPYKSMQCHHKNITITLLKSGGVFMFDSFKNMKESTEGAGIELFGNRRAIVFDCQCVVDYSEEYIVLNLGKLNLKIRGVGLILSSFSFGQTDITGDIVSLEFERVG